MTKSLENATILVVEDDVMSLEMVARMLPRLPVAGVLKAADGVEAIECMEQAGGKVDAAIVDFRMPRMHGLQLLKKIRTGETSAHAGLPCMMLTGHRDSRLFGFAMALDANAFMQKPATFGKLKTHLERIIDENATKATPDFYRRIDVEAPLNAVLEKIANTRNASETIDHPSGREFSLADDIPPGAVLGADVVGGDGQTILTAGTVLAAGTIALLRNLAEIDSSIGQLQVR